MPIPIPREGEKDEEFISRCMSDDSMEREYSDQAQRLAICRASLSRRERNEEKEDEEYREAS